MNLELNSLKNKIQKKKLIIFEGLKGTGKTVLINSFIKEYNHSCALFEEDTLRPIKHDTNISKIKDYYDRLVKRCQECDSEQILLDRFYFTKWSSLNYNKKLFYDLEKRLIEIFDASLILLVINDSDILERLKNTKKYREDSGWKLNYDGISIEEEAKKDISRQKFFIDNKYKDSLIKNKIILNTTDVEDLIGNTKSYTNIIFKRIAC